MGDKMVVDLKERSICAYKNEIERMRELYDQWQARGISKQAFCGFKLNAQPDRSQIAAIVLIRQWFVNFDVACVYKSKRVQVFNIIFEIFFKWRRA